MEEALYTYLKNLNIPFETYTHAPAFTCEQMGEINKNIPPHGGVKNLFLKDKKKRYYLLCALYDTKIELKALAKAWEAPELRFAREDELAAILGVKPGSVSLFCLINDKDHIVQVVFDQKMFGYPSIGLHPLRNDKTLLVSPQDAELFATSLGYLLRFL